MTHYTFDVHDDGPALWGDDGHECKGREDIERIARQLLDDARTRQAMRNSVDTTTSVMVMREGQGIVLNAYAEPGGGVRLVWAPA